MKPVILSRDELIEKFHLSSRVAVRLAALIAREVGVSETICEMLAGADAEPLRNMVLDRELLDRAPELDAALLAGLQKRHEAGGFFASSPLAIHTRTDGGGHRLRVICLDEELIADGAMPAAAPSAASPAAALDAAATPAMLARSVGTQLASGGGLSSEGVQQLFDPADIARIKLTVLTSADPTPKIEAIRRLRLLALDPQEKGALLLHALQDDTPAVRSEAADALTTLGLSERIATSIAMLCTGESTEREAALRALRLQAGTAREGELAVVFAVLVGTLRSGGASLALLQGVLVSLAAIAPTATLHEQPARELDRQLSRLVLTRYKELAGDIYDVYLAAKESPTMRVLARRNFTEAATPEARTFYLGLLSELDPDDESLQACIEEIAERAARGHELDPGTGRLATALRRYGVRAVRGLLRQLEQVDEDSKETILVILATVFFGATLNGSDDAAGLEDEIAKRLTAIYNTSRPQVRMAIIECPFLAHPGIGVETRREIALTLLDDLHEFRLEQTIEQVGTVLRKLGPPVLPVLRSVATTSRYQATRRQAATTIGEIAYNFHALHYPGEGGDLMSNSAEYVLRRRIGLTAEADRPVDPAQAPPPDPRDEQELRDTLAALRELLDDDRFEDKSPIYTAIGRIAWSGALSTEPLHELSEFLTSEVVSSSYAYSIVDALGYLVAARDLQRGDRAEISHFLLGLLRTNMPERISSTRASEDGDGVVHVLGHETTAYTELIPRVMQGLLRAALTPQADRDVRNRVVEQLLEVWEDLAGYRVVWGPQNTTDLAQILGRIGLSPLVEQHRTNAIVEALMKRSDSLTVLRVL
ncbi:MAG: hypothetical protein AB7S36_15675, partial [Planctomycetota bacterium]